MVEIVLVTLIHNRKEYLGKALISAWNQILDKSKWIHLLVDNASTDGAGEIAERFYNNHKDSNIRFVRLPTNIGIQNGHNYVLNEFIPNNCPEAKIFSILESDDVLPMDALFEVYKMFSEHPEIGETYSDFSIIDKNDNVLFSAHPKAVFVPNQFAPDGQKYLRQIFWQNPIGHQRSYRIMCLRDVGGFDTCYEFANDASTAAKILEKYPVIKINKVLYIWRQHGDSASGHNSAKQTQEFHDIVNTFAKRWKDRNLI